MSSGAKQKFASHEWVKGLQSSQILGLQALLIIISASIATLVDNSQVGISVLWGGFCALANVCLLLWRMRAGKNRHIDAGRQLRLFYRSALERFFVVMGLLVFGMLRLKLAPLAIIAGFVAGQAGLILAPLMRAVFNKSVRNIK